MSEFEQDLKKVDWMLMALFFVGMMAMAFLAGEDQKLEEINTVSHAERMKVYCHTPMADPLICSTLAAKGGY